MHTTRDELWVARLLLLIVSSAAALVLAEGWARWTYRPVLALTGEFLGMQAYADQLNADGFREGELTADILSDRTRRILFLGDSFTFGSGVDDPSVRFTDRLERELGADFHLYNAGIRGSRPTAWTRFARTFLNRYRPEIVVAVFFLRDGTTLGTSLHFHLNKIDQIKAKHCDHMFYRYIYLTRRIYDLRVQRDFTEWYHGEFRSAYLGSTRQRRMWVAMQQELLDLRDMSIQAGASFHLIVFPLLFDLRHYAFHDVEAQIIQFATKNDIPAISLIAGFEGHNDQDLWVSPIDQHPNALGHQIAAEILLPYLKKILK